MRLVPRRSDEPIWFDRPSPAWTAAFRRFLTVPPSVSVVVAYALLGIAAFWPVVPRFAHGLLGGENDYAEFVWFLGAVDHSLVHGHNPLFSNALFVPTGVNLAQNTSSPLLDVAVAPVALAFGPAVAANLLTLSAMPVSAAAAYIVLRKWHVRWPAAALGGALYGFSPYMVGQGLGHVQLLFLPIPPFIALTVASILQGRGPPRRLGIQLAVLVAAQYLVSEEVLATVALFTVLAVACVAIRHPASVPTIVRDAWRAVAVSLVVGAVLLAYPIWMTVAGPQHFTGTIWPSTNPYHNDLLSFVVPGPLQRVSLGLHSFEHSVLGYSNPTEAGGYLGIPVVVLAALLAWRSRHSGRMQLAVALALCAALLSLGPTLTVDGRPTPVPLPFWLLVHVPLLGNLLPARLSFEMDAFVAAALAFGVDDLLRAPERAAPRGAPRPTTVRRGSLALAGTAAVVLAVTMVPQWPYGGLPREPLPAAIRRAIPAGDPVAITYPYDTAFVTAPMIWQVDSGFRFRLLGGYAYHPDRAGRPTVFPSTMHPSGLQRFLAGQEHAALYGPPPPLNAGLVESTRTTLARYDVRLVLVDRSVPGSRPVVTLFTDALGPPSVSTGHYSMWSGIRPSRGVQATALTGSDSNRRVNAPGA